MRGYFVTGTDTGVGKTFVSVALASLATSRGQRVLAFKPIETGVDRSEGEDQTALCAAAGDWQTGELRGLYQFRLPAAPRVAAVAENRIIDCSRIVALVASIRVDLVIVEGAGGWRVPITDEIDMGGLAQHLELPVVIVSRGTLGTINHTRLTIEAVERDGLAIAAVVLSHRPEDNEQVTQSNAAEIRRGWGGQVLVAAKTGDVAPLISAG